MKYSIEPIIDALLQARKNKNLSQRELSKKVGIPQSHLSKIENQAVDIKISSLIQLARALELELVLVPRNTLALIQGLIQNNQKATPSSAQPAYQLEVSEGD